MAMAPEDMAQVKIDPVELAGREAAYLSAVEVGLGSVLHGLGVPLAGYFLSLNQGFFLSRSVAEGRELRGARTRPFTISMVASLLKSLSPAGKKLTPMLAIAVQGLLFSCGTLLFGATLAGAVAGSALASVWAFAQPLLLYWLFYGPAWPEMIRYYETRFPVVPVFVALVALKALVSAGLGVAGFRMRSASFERYRERMLGAARARLERAARSEPVSPARGALRDLLNPLFLASLGLTGIYLWFSEVRAAELAWRLLRPLALGFGVFWLVRAFPVERWVARLGGTGAPGLARSLETAARVLRGL
jgi:hypothetical protein